MSSSVSFFLNLDTEEIVVIFEEGRERMGGRGGGERENGRMRMRGERNSSSGLLC